MTGPTHEEKRQIFERFLPGKLSHNEIDSLLHFARVESYPAGKEIYAKGSLGRSMMAVLRGRAKMTRFPATERKSFLILCAPVKSSVKSPC
jgi:hypothetical protein